MYAANSALWMNRFHGHHWKLCCPQFHGNFDKRTILGVSGVVIVEIRAISLSTPLVILSLIGKSKPVVYTVQFHIIQTRTRLHLSYPSIFRYILTGSVKVRVSRSTQCLPYRRISRYLVETNPLVPQQCSQSIWWDKPQPASHYQLYRATRFTHGNSLD